ncbi:Oligosaccharide translocation protein rft1 [Serendipita sp. 411]|nr:Oligosaccharide translocation protein rft1 [Serendipita sp. 411]
MASVTGSSKDENKSSTASRLVAGASSLVLLQLLTRIVTFLLNQALVRLSTPQIFGTATIQFELLLSSIVFISREGVRLALLRSTEETRKHKITRESSEVFSDSQGGGTTTDDDGTKQIRKRNGSKPAKRVVTIGEGGANSEAKQKILSSNIATIPSLLGISLSIGLPLVYSWTASQEVKEQPHFHASVLIYTLSAVLQLAAEPMYILAQQELDFRARVTSEAAGVISRAAITVGVLLFAKRSGKVGKSAHDQADEWGLLAFAFGQLGYGLSIFVIYLWTYRSRMTEWRWFPQSVMTLEKGRVRRRSFDPQLLTLTISMTIQSFIKHLLTEGDKLAVSRTSRLADQGGYAIAANYGSVVARILFQPVEEIARVYFSKTLAICTTDGTDAPLQVDKRQEDVRDLSSSRGRPKPLSKEQQSALQQTLSTFHTLLLFQSHLLLLLITFLPPYLPILLSHFLSKKYLVTTAPSILEAYAYYLPMMSLNGVLEAFAFSVMSPQDIKTQTRWLFATSVCFGIAVWVFCEYMGQGEAGLVMANVTTLGMRAAWAAIFADRWYKRMWQRGVVRSKEDIDKVQDNPNTESAVIQQKGISLAQILPPPSVMVAFAVSFQVVRYSQSFYLPSNQALFEQSKSLEMLKAQLTHVIIGGGCGLICLLECYRTQKDHVMALLSMARNRKA